MATYGLQVFSAAGVLIFDSNTHRVMKYIKTIVSPALTPLGGSRYVYYMPELTMASSFVTVTVNSGYLMSMRIEDGKVFINCNAGTQIDLHFYRF